MIAKLIPLDGSSPIPITRDLTVVGRRKGLCDLVLNHVSVSKLHCAIAKTDGLLFIRDLGSTNGTRVNGQKVARGALLPGDELAFASVKFRVHLGPSESVATSTDQTEEIAAYPRLIEEFTEGEELVGQADGDENPGGSSQYDI